jgi:hypothetical protein
MELFTPPSAIIGGEKMTWLRKNGFWVFALVLLALVVLLVRLARLP